MSDPTLEKPNPNVSFERERGVYAIDVTHDVAHAVIRVREGAERTGDILHVFRVLADAEIPVFLNKMHRTAVTLAMFGKDRERTEKALTDAGLTVRLRRDLALVVVRATQMRDVYGVMVQIGDALTAAEARMYESGDSHNSVQCLIDGERVPATVAAFCETFALDASAVRDYSIELEAVQ